MELYSGMVLQKHITRLYRGIRFWNYIMKLCYGIILMKRIPGSPGESAEPPWTAGGPLGTPLGPSGDAPGPPRDLTDHKIWNVSTTVQRQKLSTAVFKSAHCNASP